MCIYYGCLSQIWVSSPHNGSGYYGLKDEINDALSREHFKARVQGSGDSAVEYARTGYLGFMMKSSTKKTGGKKTLPAYGCVCVCACLKGSVVYKSGLV